MILLTNIKDKEFYPDDNTSEIISDYVFLTPKRVCYDYFKSPKWYWDTFCFYVFDNRVEVNINFYVL